MCSSRNLVKFFWQNSSSLQFHVFDVAEHGWPVIGAINLLKAKRKREVYDGRPPLAELFEKHGDIFRLKLPGKFAVD